MKPAPRRQRPRDARAAGRLRIGCAGWSLPAAVRTQFPAEGSHLQRYAARLNAAEINSSFYRPHQASTYARWADSVPDDFRFAVKLPRAITHDARLRGVRLELDAFLLQVRALGPRLGCLLIQLPPSLAFDRAVAGRFLALLRRRHDGAVVVEPRHASWFGAPAAVLLSAHGVGRAAADPAIVAAAAEPGGDERVCYFRLHGSPRMYFSVYDDSFLRRLARDVRLARHRAAEVWCIFDNTAHGGAVPNALRTAVLTQR